MRVAYAILDSLGLRRRGVNLVSCPTCGRCKIDLRKLVAKVESKIRGVDKPMTVAVMGCVVNGPGEAREADVGIAGAKGRGIFFKKGKVVRTGTEKELLSLLCEEIDRWKG